MREYVHAPLATSERGVLARWQSAWHDMLFDSHTAAHVRSHCKRPGDPAAPLTGFARRACSLLLRAVTFRPLISIMGC